MKIMRIAGKVLVGLVILGVLAVTVWSVRAYRQPLGPTLEVGVGAPAVLIDARSEPLAAPRAQAEVCGETGAWNVLVLGSDAADLRGVRGSDLTRMLRVDFPNKKVAIYAFSRDLWVETAGLGLTDPAVEAARLGEVFYEARIRSTKTNVKEAMLDATNVTARMLSNNFSISTDHYLTIDLVQIPAMVDLVGGIPVDIPQATTDPFIGVVIPAGQQTLNGAQFVAYARAIPDSDFGRIQRSNLLVAALREKLLDPGVWGKIPEFYTQFNEVIATDLSPEQINHLSCLLKEVPQDAILQDQVRQEWTSPGPQAGALVWDKTTVLNRLKELDLIP
jgi:LCP family protein required for cell wall assembly